MSHSNRRSIIKLSQKFTSLSAVETIRRGLISMIPILLVGAFALTAKYFPIKSYQEFLEVFLNGFISDLLQTVYDVTFGLLSVYMCIAMGYHFASIKAEKGRGTIIGYPIVALACFFILIGFSELDTATLGPKGMFISIIASLGSSYVFHLFVSKVKIKRLLAEGADINLNNALRFILPLAITIAIFAILNNLILLASDGITLYGLFQKAASKLFSVTGGGFISGLLFVLVSSILWFFGIHGSDVLEGVAQEMFVPNIDINMGLVEAGMAPTEILTKQFFDVFVLMGGCGSAICLLIAILIFGKRKSNLGLARMASIPMLFNINEIMVFGLPIIYNPIMLIPFLLVPVVCYLVSYAAMYFGIVPLVISPLEWTTPVILGGYAATESVAGSLLQVINIIIGVLIYRPFVKRYDVERLENTKRDYEHIVSVLKDREQSREEFSLTELPGSDGAFAKSFAAEIEHAIEEDKLEIYYQPQYRLDGTCFGAEALLRFKLSSIGMVYPPLVIELAKESGKLQALEKYVFEHVVADSERLSETDVEPIKLSINVSGPSIQNRDFEKFLINLIASYRGKHKLCIEITEQTAIVFNDELKDRIRRLKDAGYSFAIDDFSAGNTSLQYLQENSFDIVKLDGSIVQNCLTNERCNEFTTMIIELSHNLGFQVVAEFVSSVEIRDCMAKAGCTLYQGWLYSPAVTYDELVKKLAAKE